MASTHHTELVAHTAIRKFGKYSRALLFLVIICNEELIDVINRFIQASRLDYVYRDETFFTGKMLCWRYVKKLYAPD